MARRRRNGRFSGPFWLLFGAVVCVAAIAALQRAAPVSQAHGEARVVDGDTLIVAGQTIRLMGIDAPEYDQLCQRSSGAEWDCGSEAKWALIDIIGGRPVDCQGTETDRYGRLLALCFEGGTDIGAQLVRRGLAVARSEYETELAAARQAAAGIWAGDFEDPADWRRRGRADSESVIDWILDLFTS
jgi:endonuclease YncB( thermonuclease family)